MRRTTVVIATCMVVLGLTATSASASLANPTTSVCQADATWNVNVPAATATVSWDTGSATGCKGLNGTVYEDGNFQVGTSDHGTAANWTLGLFGVAVTGQNSFAGTVRSGPWTLGTLEVAGGVALSAQLTLPFLGWNGVFVHYPTGTCGSDCYKTRMVFDESTYGP